MLSFIFNQWDVEFPGGGLAGSGVGGIGLRRPRDFEYVDHENEAVYPARRRVRTFKTIPIADIPSGERRRQSKFPEETFVDSGERRLSFRFESATLTVPTSTRRFDFRDDRQLTVTSAVRLRKDELEGV